MMVYLNACRDEKMKTVVLKRMNIFYVTDKPLDQSELPNFLPGKGKTLAIRKEDADKEYFARIDYPAQQWMGKEGRT